jgi:hypothetical protein
MKTPLLIALLGLAAGHSFAQDVVPFRDTAGAAGLTRAQVAAETARALRSGQQVGGDYTPIPPSVGRSSLTRAEVREQTTEALARHEVALGDVERFHDAATGIGRTRSEVTAEARSYPRVAGGAAAYANGNVLQPNVAVPALHLRGPASQYARSSHGE